MVRSGYLPSFFDMTFIIPLGEDYAEVYWAHPCYAFHVDVAWQGIPQKFGNNPRATNVDFDALVDETSVSQPIPADKNLKIIRIGLEQGDGEDAHRLCLRGAFGNEVKLKADCSS